MFDAIYACKLYRASDRKDKIQAAFENPINSELVSQLSKALDEEYKKPELLIKNYEEKKQRKEQEAAQESQANDSGADIDPTEGHSPEDMSAARPHRSAPPASGPNNTNDSSESNDDLPSSESNDSTDNETVEESTNIQGTTILGSLPREKFQDMKQVSEQLKNMLNFKDSTQGVSRILAKEDELWIYYNDDINLNNVMDNVITTLNISGYDYLEFNRLARSDNAIVFQIMFRDSYHGQKTSSITE